MLVLIAVIGTLAIVALAYLSYQNGYRKALEDTENLMAYTESVCIQKKETSEKGEEE